MSRRHICTAIGPASRDDAVLAFGIEIGQQDGQRLADDPAAVGGNAVAAEGEPGSFEVQQLTAGQIDGDLLGVLLPAAGLAPGVGCGAAPGGAEQLVHARQGYPP